MISQMTIMVAMKIMMNSSQIGQMTMVFSMMDSSPKILTVCLARKIPIEGSSQVSVWYSSLSGMIKVVYGFSSLVQISSSENIGQTCKVHDASVCTFPLFLTREEATRGLFSRNDGMEFSITVASSCVSPATSA